MKVTSIQILYLQENKLKRALKRFLSEIKEKLSQLVIIVVQKHTRKNKKQKQINFFNLV